MKTIKKSLTALVLLTVLTANANFNIVDHLTYNVKKTTLKLNNVKSGQELVIKDVDETVLYRENILNSGEYHREFDLTSLPEGKYSFELDQGFAYRIMPFKVVGSETVFNQEKEQLIFKPIISTEGIKLNIGKSPLSIASIKVKIYYESGNDEIIFTDEVESTKKGFRTYKLLDHMRGTYRVVCESEGRIFTKRFKI